MGFGLWQRVVITGGTGFLGSALAHRLSSMCLRDLYPLGRCDYDLTDHRQAESMLCELRPTLLFHLAAVVGGIGANRANPGRFFYENLVMGANVIEQARRCGVQKLVVVGTICSYPKHAPVPFREESLWTGYPEETNAPYGIAKLALLTQLQAYRKQYGMNGIYIMPVNLFGPGDNFDPQTSHVIPALIRKFVEAKEAGARSVEVWGSGKPSREFLYVDDAVEGIVRAAEQYESDEPVNLGTGREITIRELAELIADITEFRGELHFNEDWPDGQPRRCLDTRRARESFGFEARVDLRDGIDRVTKWYLAQRRSQTLSELGTASRAISARASIVNAR